jgi:translation initiation factor IF-3
MRVNQAIRARQVRVIASNGDQAGIMELSDALALARSESLDLVEIAPNSEPPVCKVMNYGKYKFQQSKKAKDAKQKQRQIQVKEIKLRPRIDDHDLETKLRHVKKFIGHGDKVRVFVHFRGREMAHRDLGLKLLQKAIELLGDEVAVEKQPTMEGNQMSMFLIGKDFAAKQKPKK